MKDRAYTQVYTGNGKGKTTAAIGLTIRALGAGLNVFFGQFVKGMRYSEIAMLESLGASLGRDRLVVEQFGRGCFVYRAPEAEDRLAARNGLNRAREAMLSGRFDLVVLDELNIAVHQGLVEEADALDFVKSRPGNVELVVTGRYARDSILGLADLVTEMREVRHYFSAGVEARDGIER